MSGSPSTVAFPLPSMNSMLSRIQHPNRSSRPSLLEMRRYLHNAPEDQAERVRLAWQLQHDGDKAEDEGQEAEDILSMDEAMRTRPDGAYERITSQIYGYKSTIEKMKKVRDNYGVTKRRLLEQRRGNRLTLQDQQHPWILHRKRQSGAYNRGLLSIFEAMKTNNVGWRRASLIICRVTLERLAKASRWDGPSGQWFSAAAAQFDSGDIDSDIDWTGLVAAAEDHFEGKAQQKAIARRGEYHCLFRVVQIPSGSYIILSFCHNELAAGQVPSNFDRLSSSELSSWQGRKGSLAAVQSAEPVGFVEATPAGTPPPALSPPSTPQRNWTLRAFFGM